MREMKSWATKGTVDNLKLELAIGLIQEVRKKRIF
jgi:hypothetical protein